MNKDTLLYSIVGLLVGVIITGFVVSYSVNHNSVGMMRMMGIGSSTDQDNAKDSRKMMGNIDRHFIEQMVPHHKDAIMMADMAVSRAQHQEIKTLANDIKRSQSAEIEQMKSWYQDWFGVKVPEEMMGDDTDMMSLKNASNFDQAFIEEMTSHHQMAVMMGNMLLSSTNRPEMKKLAEDIISAQTKEINEMRQWAKEWGYTSRQN